MKNSKWLSPIPKNCEVCNKPLGKYFIDGKTVLGCWGLMCEDCHKMAGGELGIGKGQKYLTKDGTGVGGFKE